MRLRAALAALLIAGGCASNESVVQQPAGGFAPGGRRFASREAFMQSNALCGTRPISADEMIQIASRHVEIATVSPVTIEVWVHVLMDDEGKGALPDQVIAEQIEVLNKAFNGNSGGAASRFMFQHAGTTRTSKSAWFRMGYKSFEEGDAKSRLRRGDRRTLNIYTAEPPGPDNWATFPQDYAAMPAADGVVVHYGTLPGGKYRPWHLGDMVVHETGHWLGLAHTFANGCSSTGDGIADTAAEFDEANGCPTGRDSCSDPAYPGNDPVTNFMDYTDDSCRLEFTAGQFDFMSATWNTFRK